MSASTVPAGAAHAGWFRAILLVARRELGAYFDSSIAYVYLTGFIVLANAVFMNDFFLAGRAEMTAWFESLPLMLAVFLPAVTMRLWAEERKQRTLESLLTLPIVPLQAIAGKYLAALSLHFVFLAGSLPIPVMLVVLGEPDPGLIAGGYLGAILLGGLLIALGMCLSALSGDQIVAFVLSTVIGVFLVLLGDDRVATILDGLVPAFHVGSILRDAISVTPRFEAFVRGLVELGAVAWFILLAAVLLALNALLLERLRA
ncbi:MAG: hypothetical protein KF817_06250 [Phycisphaeraceae bacterium]|nr:hypothetical protein [Phycisphaeraceae bacterium]